MRNYIKSADKLIFFDDSKEDATAIAYYQALLYGPDPVFFRPPFHAGPWDTLAVVGHRAPAEIAVDMHHADHPVDAQRLIAESKHLDSAYDGREPRPVVPVGLRLV